MIREISPVKDCVDQAHLQETIFSVNDNLIPRLVSED